MTDQNVPPPAAQPAPVAGEPIAAPQAAPVPEPAATPAPGAPEPASTPAPEEASAPAAEPAAPAVSWAQPPEAGSATAGWAQPPSAAARRLYGSTEAKLWQPNAELAALAEQAAEAERQAEARRAPTPAPASYAPVRTFVPTVQSCPRCGGNIDFDGYCEQCGAKAPSVREHFEESPADWVGGVCDRGIRHSSNEDAMALDATAHVGGRAALVVCDGVSMSTDSDKASLAASRAAISHLTARSDWDWNLAEVGPESATGKLLAETVVRANQAVLDNSDLTEMSPASCTLAIGLVSGRQLLAATLGDSRVYWLPDAGPATLLSTDDSMAQEQIAAGMEREIAETGIHGHVITKWLGRDAPDLTPLLEITLAEGPGWLLVCSDGLWNYASAPATMGELVAHFAANTGNDPVALARELVTWANDQGGHDNITAALARIDQPPPLTPPDVAEEAPVAVPVDAPTTRTRPAAAAEPTPTS